jgi:hypothetical protein
MLEVTIEIHNKRQKGIHIADREEIRGNSSVVRLQKLMEEVLVVGTVQDASAGLWGLPIMYL